MEINLRAVLLARHIAFTMDVDSCCSGYIYNEYHRRFYHGFYSVILTHSIEDLGSVEHQDVMLSSSLRIVRFNETQSFNKITEFTLHKGILKDIS